MKKNQLLSNATSETVKLHIESQKPASIPAAMYPEVAPIAYYDCQDDTPAKPSLIGKIRELFQNTSASNIDAEPLADLSAE